MKKLVILLFIALCSFSVWGQNLVSIPDSIFREYIKNRFPSCFVGNMLDTIAANNNPNRHLEIVHPRITSIEGVQYFKKLEWLDVSSTNISFISSLPPNLISLNCSNNNLNSLPQLPFNLRWLDCRQNNISTLPSLTGHTLSSINISNNQISYIPALGEKVEELRCMHNPLTCLPTLPSGLLVLETSVACIKNIPFNLLSSRPPLCDSITNISNCEFSTYIPPLVSGYFFNDANYNGTLDSNESKIGNQSILVHPFNVIIATNVEGEYSFYSDTINTLMVIPNTLPGFRYPDPVYLPRQSSGSNTVVNFGLHYDTSSVVTPNQPIVNIKVYYDVNQNSQIDPIDVRAQSNEIHIQPGNIILFTNSAGEVEYALDTNQIYTISLASDSASRQVLPRLSSNSRTNVSLLTTFVHGFWVPDSAFRSQLKSQFPACFVGDLLDTMCASVARNPYGWGIQIAGDSIKSIEGIRFFKNITWINIVQTSIKALPVLPKSITSLTISNNNQIETIHSLPDSLNTFSAYYNPKLNFDQLAEFPDGLTNLYCFNNNISHFPTLPRGLKYFNCSNNSLAFLPNIPDSLFSLDCSLNQLTSITGLTSPALRTVNFSSNNISECPAFGKNLRMIQCHHNPFSCLKTLPDSLYYLETDVRCIPNIPKNLMPTVTSTTGAKLALCNPTNNPYNCQVNPTVQGKIFYDLNNNQTYDAGDVVASNQKINLSPTDSYTFSDSLGNFIMDIDTVGQYVLSLATVPYFISSPSVTVNGFGLNVSTTVNFYYTKTADVKDIAVVLTPYQAAARPGFPFSMDVTVRNNGTIPTTAQVAIQLPSAYSVSGIVFPNCSTTSANIPCTIGTLQPGQTIRGLVEGRIRPTATLGDSISFVAEVNGGDVSDANLTNNLSLANFVIRGSYDPNDKAGTSLDPSKVGQSQWIDYTIRFQNTGTDTAFTVVVADSLPAELRPSTVEILSVSHAYVFSKTNNILYFQFNNILLADSNTNEKASHGFIKFRIKALANLPLSASIRNRAAIYFDYNAPVITDYAISSFISPARVTLIPTAEQSQAATYVYPNPVANGRLFVHSGVQNEFQLFNSSGFVVAKGKIEDNGIDVSSLPAGIYLLHMGNHKQKVVIE